MEEHRLFCASVDDLDSFHVDTLLGERLHILRQEAIVVNHNETMIDGSQGPFRRFCNGTRPAHVQESEVEDAFELTETGMSLE